VDISKVVTVHKIALPVLRAPNSRVVRQTPSNITVYNESILCLNSMFSPWRQRVSTYWPLIYFYKLQVLYIANWEHQAS